MRLFLLVIVFTINNNLLAQELHNETNLNFSIISAGLSLSNDTSDRFINIVFFNNYYISKAVGLCFSGSIDVGLTNTLSNGLINITPCMFLSLIENKSLFIYTYIGSGFTLGHLKELDRVRMGLNGLLGFGIGFDRIGININIRPNLIGNIKLDLITYGLNYRF